MKKIDQIIEKCGLDITDPRDRELLYLALMEDLDRIGALPPESSTRLDQKLKSLGLRK